MWREGGGGGRLRTFCLGLPLAWVHMYYVMYIKLECCTAGLWVAGHLGHQLAVFAEAPPFVSVAALERDLCRCLQHIREKSSTVDCLRRVVNAQRDHTNGHVKEKQCCVLNWTEILFYKKDKVYLN